MGSDGNAEMGNGNVGEMGSATINCGISCCSSRWVLFEQSIDVNSKFTQSMTIPPIP